MSFFSHKNDTKNSKLPEVKEEVKKEDVVDEPLNLEANVASETIDSTDADTLTQVKESEPVKLDKKEEAPRKIVCVSKIGSDHIFANMNNHDFAFKIPKIKAVMDGCGSGSHSEIGTKLFGQLFVRKAKELYDSGEYITEENFVEVVDQLFEKMLFLCDDKNFIFDNYCFTILVCFETDDEFVVYSSGDGYIIKETKDGISFEELDDGEYPAYYVYNFFKDKSVLKEYKDGVRFKIHHFNKEEFLNVGVATDGLRYAKKLLDVEKNKLMQFLHDGKGKKIEILINRNNRKNEMFRDDISICF